MGTFTINAPDGKSYTIEGDNADGALAALKKHLGDAPNESASDVPLDVAKSAGVGVVKGGIGLIGMPGDAGSLVGSAVDRAGAALGASPEAIARFKKFAGTAARATPVGALMNGPTSQDIQAGVEKITGPLYQPKTTAGEYAQTAGEFLPAAIGGPEGIAGRLMSRVALPALASETAGQITKGSAVEPYARTAAALATPAALAAARGVTAPIFANIEARRNPQGFAEGQVARAIHESGVSPADLSLRTIQAANEGQPQFTLADAMGNAGHEMLGAAARGAGAGRTAIVDALEARQAGQGRRVASTLAEGFDSPRTAAQTKSAMETARDTAADAEYGAVRNSSQPVDVTNVLDHIDQQVAPFGVAHDRISPDGITGSLLKFRRMLGGDAANLNGSAAGGLNDFRAAQMVRQELSNDVQKAVRGGEGPKARALGQVLSRLDASLENASSGFKDANANFAQASRNIDAIDSGRSAALRGRPEDTIPAFQGLPPQGQAAFRAGYSDPLIADAQSAPFGANKARPLTSDAFRDESAAIAPGNDMMQRRLGREMTMFEGRNTALGGSPTAKNLAHDAAMGVDPHLAMDVITGNYHGAVRRILAAGQNAVTGNTPAVREAVANILLQNGANVNPAQLQQLVDRTVQRIQFAQSIAHRMARNGIASVAATSSGYHNAENGNR